MQEQNMNKYNKAN